MSGIRERVQENFASLSRVQKDVIQRILNDYESYVFLTVDEASETLGIHKSTLVRLAQALSYTGYPEMRAAIQQVYRQEITLGRKLGHTLAEIQDDHVFEQLVQTETEYLKEALKTVRQDDIRRVAELIISSHRTFLFGRGHEGPVEDLFSFRLRRFHIETELVTEEGRAILEKVQLLTADDLVIICSFLYIPKEYEMVIEWAKEVGAPVVLITDTVAKELIDEVSVVLAARRGSVTIYHTNIVPLAIQNAIVLTVAKLQGAQALAGLDRLQELRRRFGYDFADTPSVEKG